MIHKATLEWRKFVRRGIPPPIGFYKTLCRSEADNYITDAPAVREVTCPDCLFLMFGERKRHNEE